MGRAGFSGSGSGGGIGNGIGLGLAVSAAAIAWDPSAHASEPKRVLALVIAMVAAAHALFRRSTNRSPDTFAATTTTLPWTWRFAVAFLALSALSAFWGSPAALLDLGTWGAAAICAVTSARSGRPAALRAVRIASLTTGSIVSIWALVLVAFGHRGFDVHAGQGNPNWLGLLLAITLPISIDVLREADLLSRRLRALAFALVAIQPAALYAAHSRVAEVAIVVALLWMVWRVRSDRDARRGAMKLFAVSAALMGLVVAAERMHTHPPKAASTTTAATKAPTTPTTPTTSVSHAPEDVTAARSLAGRRWIATQSFEASKRAGVFGAGLGRFHSAYLEAQGDALSALTVRASARGFINATTAHNEPLQIAVESGPLAALFLILMLGASFVEHRRAKWDAGAAMAIALAIMSLGDSPLRQPAICLLFGLACAKLPSEQRALSSSAMRAAHAITGVPIAFAEEHRRTPHPRPQPSRAVCMLFAIIATATLLLPSATRAWMGTRALEQAYVAEPSSSRFARIKKATRINPHSADAWLALGLQDLADGRPEKAIPYLWQADRLEPTIAARVALGEASLARHDAEEAKRVLLRAVAIAPGSLRARLALAEAERELGHAEEAALHADAARAVAPFDPRVADIHDRLHEDEMDLPIN